MCSFLPTLYDLIDEKVCENNVNGMKQKIMESNSTHCTRYREISNCEYNDVLYNQFMREDRRIVLSRWRLSCHSLRVETGRYTNPITERAHRTCSVCTSCVEDEQHVIFVCPIYNRIRRKYMDLLMRYPTAAEILNPLVVSDAELIGDMLLQVEELRKDEIL